MKKVESFEHGCEILGIQPVLPDFSHLPADMQKGLLAHYKLVIIHAADKVLASVTLDWGNLGQLKWSGWWNMGGSSGSRFSFGGSGYGFVGDGSHVGSRLSAVSDERMDYIAEDFGDLYKDYFIIQPEA